MGRAQLTVSALLLGSLLVAIPPGHAAGEQYLGGCALDVTSQATLTNEAYVGTVSAHVVTYSSSGPVSATIWCKVQVNGSDAPGTEHSYSGALVQTGADQVSFNASDEDIVRLCVRMDIAWSTGTYACGDTVDVQFPPQELEDALTQIGDPITCPVLASFAPGVPGVVDIDPYGETVIAGVTAWDCPPYGSLAPRRGNGGNGKGHHKHGETSSQSTAPGPSPFYPSGTIDMDANLGPTNVHYSNFNPPFSEWSCVTSATSVTCTPPAAPSGYYNVCGALNVEATSLGVGSVTGTSACDSGPAAVATSNGPTATPAKGSARADTDFPWTCAASASSAAWTVHCTVGP